MAQIGTLETFSATDTVSAQPLQYNYVEIRDKYNEHDAAITDVHGVVSPAYILSESGIDTLLSKYCPIGTVKYVWDNDNSEIRALIDSDRFQEFNGDVCSDIDSLYYGYTIPDMDQCFIVGAGTTDGSGDIATACIALTKCGNVIASFDHDHTTITHTHTLNSHTHSFNHSHDFTTYACMGVYAPTLRLYYTTIENSQSTTTNQYYINVLSSATSVSSNHSYGFKSLNNSYSTNISIGSQTGILAGVSIVSQEYNNDLEMRPLCCRVKAYLRIK